jgi:hypothetical protein
MCILHFFIQSRCFLKMNTCTEETIFTSSPFRWSIVLSRMWPLYCLHCHSHYCSRQSGKNTFGKRNCSARGGSSSAVCPRSLGGGRGNATGGLCWGGTWRLLCFCFCTCKQDMCLILHVTHALLHVSARSRKSHTNRANPPCVHQLTRTQRQVHR